MKQIGAEDVARHAEMLANRVKKNHRRLAKRFEQASIGAYRLYDWDIPEVRAVVDWYEGHLVVAEYEREQTKVPGYLERLGAAAAAALGVPEASLHLKTRRTRPKTGARYGRLATTGNEMPVREGDLRFLVNLEDYVDTGLFPDHRETRRRVREEAKAKRFLNLFSYTGTFTCAAAKGGATRTTSVDLSRRYLEWAERNLKLNRFQGRQHVMVQSDVVQFLREAKGRSERFDLAVLDPPSFSTKAGGGDLDVNRDHRRLVEDTLTLLGRGGVLYFSTNHQRFEPALRGLPGDVKEITEETIPEDYRNRRIHRTFRIVRRR